MESQSKKISSSYFPHVGLKFNMTAAKTLQRRIPYRDSEKPGTQRTGNPNESLRVKYFIVNFNDIVWYIHGLFTVNTRGDK